MDDNRSDVMNRLSRINKKLFTVNGMGEKSFLGRGQINVLKEIINHDKISQDELARILVLDKTTVAKAVKKLETHGLITRRRSKADQRKKELTATKKALMISKEMKSFMEDSSNSLFHGISDEEMESFKSVLEKIEDNIELSRKKLSGKRQVGMEVMNLIKENDGLSTERLAALLKKEDSLLTEIIERLITKDFIEENRGILSLTSRGSEIISSPQRTG